MMSALGRGGGYQKKEGKIREVVRALYSRSVLNVDKGEGGSKNPKNYGTSFMDGPFWCPFLGHE